MTVAAPGGLVRLGEKPRVLGYLRAIWARRQFAIAVPVGQLKAQNFDTAFGALWHLLNPLLMAGVYYLVFGLMLNTRRGVDNFVIFLTIGVFVFHYTSKCIITGATAITKNVGLIRSISFPKAILPMSAVIGETVAFLPAIAVMLIIALLTGEPLAPSWLLLVPAFALQLTFNLGAALILARLTDHFLDVQQFLPYMIRLWLYFSGVFYVIDGFIENPLYNAALKANPAYVYITLARNAVLAEPSPAALWASAAAWGITTLALGFIFFLRKEQTYGRG